MDAIEKTHKQAPSKQQQKNPNQNPKNSCSFTFYVRDLLLSFCPSL